MTAFSLIYTFTPTLKHISGKTVVWTPACIRPNTIDDFLTRCTFDESSSLADDGHLNCVPNPVLEVFSFFSGLSHNVVVRTRVHGPTSGDRQSQIQYVVAIFCQHASGKDLADCCTTPRNRARTNTLVTNEVDPVDKKAEDNGFVPVALDCTVLFLEGTDEGVCQVRCGELKEQSERGSQRMDIEGELTAS
jgi:hypothetical protein